VDAVPETTKDRLAARKLIATLPGGEEKPIEVVICRPYELATGEWECLFAIVGMYEDWPPARADDAWGALTLALGFLRSLLEGLINHGGSVSSTRGGDPMELTDIFP